MKYISSSSYLGRGGRRRSALALEPEVEAAGAALLELLLTES
jgi:hypothetical protein